MAKPGDGEKDWDQHLRAISLSARDSSSSSDPSVDASLLKSVQILHKTCKNENSGDLMARVYPQINRLFQRSLASPKFQSSENGLLLLFFLDFGDIVLHDADPSLQSFFRLCLSRQFADPIVAEATLSFLILNKEKILSSFPGLLPQFFPLLLKLIAWHGEKLEKSFLMVFPAMVAQGSFLPLFPSLVDLPILVIALEKVEKSSGSLIGSSIASMQKSTAPEMLLALMDEAYTGSSIEDRGADSGDENDRSVDVADSLFLELLKDENEGLSERHWTSTGIAASLQAAIGTRQSDRLRQSLHMSVRLLDVYFAIALEEVNDSLICALIPLLMTRHSTLFPDKNFIAEVRRSLLEFMLAAFQRSPGFIAILKKPIIDRLGEAYDSSAKNELALQLCWAIGEHGGGGTSHKDTARELFESLELLLYENISSSRLGLGKDPTASMDETIFGKSSQARLLCFVITAIAKLATCHRELLPRARVCLAKVARSRSSLDMRVWRRARDYLGLMNEPAICLSVLGPVSGCGPKPGTVNWSEGGSKMVAHIPFYLLNEQEGPPFHDFSFTDVFPGQ
ncbi:uncharacterized protein LOC116264226 isoform X2 [Nymphaea colorata]|uniref:uncharacterized protein LOC116264226 isoform X2 n=1 Tax=Nymphaea colorata TaxID=210225 RepID=UPI00129D6641|nr:uncharacterized protein LOC116264226 isoform X2 [Nymphaea colorata]